MRGHSAWRSLNGRDFLNLGILSGATQTSGTTVSDFTTFQAGHPDRTIVINAIEQDLTGCLIDGMLTAESRITPRAKSQPKCAIPRARWDRGCF